MEALSLSILYEYSWGADSGEAEEIIMNWRGRRKLGVGVCSELICWRNICLRNAARGIDDCETLFIALRS